MSYRKLSILVTALFVAAAFAGCAAATEDTTGPQKVNVKVPTGSDGRTTEQRNIEQRLLADNAPGSIKHLYVISAMSGQVLIYSTVDGKVTSSGKRLTPLTTTGHGDGAVGASYYKVNVRGHTISTTEVMQDDGTYGSSIDYLYWWDVRGVYHQHYVTGGQILHVSDQPLAVKDIVLNLEAVAS